MRIVCSVQSIDVNGQNAVFDRFYDTYFKKQRERSGLIHFKRKEMFVL